VKPATPAVDAEAASADETNAPGWVEAADAAPWPDDPYGFVMNVFAWGTGDLTGHDGPDTWQAEVLRDIATHLRSDDRRRPLRIAVASGHGVGKSALVAWLILWAVSTRPNLAGVVTANTAAQLRTKTWRELALWHRRSANRDWFEQTETRFAKKSAPSLWGIAALPWSRERPEAFAGLHAEHVLVIYDEASAIPDEIWEVSEGAMTTAGAMWFAFGNPTRTTGRFRECFGRFRNRWTARQVDARKSRLASADQIREWIADYGEDSDFVKIRVKGEFPSSGTAQFIGGDVIADARSRVSDDAVFLDAPLVMGVDVARFGDDATAVLLRRGDSIVRIDRYRGLDTMQVVGRVSETIARDCPAAVFIDGIGVGAGVVDRLRQLGFRINDINAGARAIEERRYGNRRAEMWGRMRDWLRGGGCLPDDATLAADLVAPEYGFDSQNRIVLEKKEDMRRRGLASPDVGDALALTFAEHVAVPIPGEVVHDQTMNEWNPFAWQG
jgi:hypothetical protein